VFRAIRIVLCRGASADRDSGKVFPTASNHGVRFRIGIIPGAVIPFQTEREKREDDAGFSLNACQYNEK
jgi:hypothetical protein